MLTYAALPIRGPSHYMTATAAKPPLIWANALMFAITFAAAAVLVPWYGLRYGFTGADWGIFAFFLIANGMSIWCSAPWRCRAASSPGAAGIAHIT